MEAVSGRNLIGPTGILRWSDMSNNKSRLRNAKITNKDWSVSPLAIIIGFIVACIAIYAFNNIKQTVSKFLAVSKPEELVAVSTPTAANQFPILNGSPNDWLIGSDELPDEMMHISSQSYSNQDISNFYDNPAEILMQLQEWGRVTSSWQQYSHEDGCDSKSGLREIILQAILFNESSGAQETMDWYVSSIEYKEMTTIAGESGYIYWQEDESTCEPPEKLTYVTIIFRRYNVIASVDIGSITGTVSDSDMLQLIQHLAQSIDLRLVKAAK